MEGTPVQTNANLRRLGAFVGIAFAILASRLWYLQIMRGATYEALSQGNRIRLIPVTAPRGRILDRNGVPLATSRMAFSVSIVPQDVRDMDATIAHLAPLLGMSADDIRQVLAQPRRPFEPVRIKTDVDPAVVTAIGEHRTDLPGVVVEELPVRNYVYGEFASQLLGYVREIDANELKTFKSEGYEPGDLIGKVGVERAFEQYLRGKDGGEQVEVNSLSQPIEVLGSVAPIPGNDVVLTIDARLQKAAEDALEQELETLARSPKTRNAKAGAVVAIDPRTGEILAMVSKPAYDPNTFVGEVTPDELRLLSSSPSPQPNRVTSHAYPPGSTFKAITVLAALERHKVTLDDRFVCTGRDPVSGKLCWTVERGRGHGTQDLLAGIANSCNIVFYELGRRTGIDDLAEFARMFGLGSSTGIALFPPDSPGLVPDRAWKRANFKGYDQRWYPDETLDVSIGQGALLTTPLQLANVYAAIAAGGTLRRPIVARAILDKDGGVIEEFRSEVVRQVNVSAESLDILKAGLAKVVSEGTAAAAFRGFPVPVAGKTGTAQNPEGESHGWFAAFAPVDSPRIVVLVLVEHATSGALAAAPVARKVLEAYFGVSRSPSRPADATAPAASGEGPERGKPAEGEPAQGEPAQGAIQEPSEDAPTP